MLHVLGCCSMLRGFVSLFQISIWVCPVPYVLLENMLDNWLLKLLGKIEREKDVLRCVFFEEEAFYSFVSAKEFTYESANY